MWKRNASRQLHHRPDGGEAHRGPSSQTRQARAPASSPRPPDAGQPCLSFAPIPCEDERDGAGESCRPGAPQRAVAPSRSDTWPLRGSLDPPKTAGSASRCRHKGVPERGTSLKCLSIVEQGVESVQQGASTPEKERRSRGGCLGAGGTLARESRPGFRPAGSNHHWISPGWCLTGYRWTPDPPGSPWHPHPPTDLLFQGLLPPVSIEHWGVPRFSVTMDRCRKVQVFTPWRLPPRLLRFGEGGEHADPGHRE